MIGILIILYSYNTIGNVSPPSSSIRITDDDLDRITDDSFDRITDN